MTIRGAGFKPDAIVKLVRPDIQEIEPARYEVIDATRIIATFDFADQPHGLYDLTVINPDGAQATLPYRYLIERALEIDVTIVSAVLALYRLDSQGSTAFHCRA